MENQNLFKTALIGTGDFASVDVISSPENVQPSDYEALILSAGPATADALRVNSRVLHWVRHFNETEKPLAVIGHAAWILISAGVVEGRVLTSAESLQDDLKNAGALWVDQSAVLNQNWVSCRGLQDIQAFNREWTKLLARTPHLSPTAAVVNVAMSA